jgi:hypothetical protein
MSEFYITNENTEDTLDSADNLEDAIRIAKELAENGQTGELVCIEHKGRNIRQFVLTANGNVAEVAIAGR